MLKFAEILNIKKMSRLYITIFLTLVSIYNLSAKKDYYELVDSAENNIKIQKWDRAELFLKEVLKNYPDDNNNSLIISNLATVQRYQGKYQEAINNYTFAINMTPNAVTLLKNRASLYLDIDSVTDALEDFERILLLDEKDEETRYYHGILSIRVGDMDAAKKDFDYILFYNPSSGLGREGLALWFKKRGDNIEAIKYYTEIIKQHPSAIRLSNRAECYLSLKRLNDAESDIRKALEMAPEDAYLYVLRAKLNKARFNRADVERDLDLAEKYGISRKLSNQLINDAR